MSMWDRITAAGVAWLTGPEPPPATLLQQIAATKAAAAPSVPPASSAVQPYGMQPGRPAYPSTDIASLQRAYIQNPLVFACVKLRSDCAQVARLVVETQINHATEAPKWQPVPDAPLTTLLSQPNPDEGEAAFTQRALVDLDTTGLFYAEITRNGLGLPIRMDRINPARVAPVPGADRYTLAAYRVDLGGGKSVEIPAANMLVRRLPHPVLPWEGLAPLAVALGMVDSDNAQTDYTRGFFNNAGVVSGFLQVAGRVDQREADQIRDNWRARFGRAFGRQHDIAVTDDRVKYVPTGSKINELDSALLRSIAESRVGMVFGVPPLLIYAYIGLLRATYNNLPAAQRGFWDNTMVPWFEAHAQWLQRRLLPEYVPQALITAGRVRCRYDLSAVTALQDNADAVADRHRSNFERGGETLNEFRAAISLPADPGGDYYVRRVQFVATRFGTDVADIPSGAGTTGTGNLTGNAVDAAEALIAQAQETARAGKG